MFIKDLGDARAVALLSDGEREDYLAVELRVQEYGLAEPTLVRVGLSGRNAGHLLELLSNAQRRLGFPLPSGSISTEKPQ